MLYLTGINDTINDEEIQYSVFETNTESILRGNKEFVIKLLKKCKTAAINFCVNEGQIELKQWPHEIRRSSEVEVGDNVRSAYILMAKVTDRKFKLVSWKGLTRYVNEEELKVIIEQGKIANCKIEIGKEPIYKSIDTYNICSNIAFERHIASKYKEFRAKVLLLGLNISFEYTIEEKNVKLVNYTGTSKTVILPSFITALHKRAFKNEAITELKLSAGLKYIGNEAFMFNNITYIEIPKTVQFIGQDAFKLNKKLVDADGKLNTATFKLINRSTLIVDHINQAESELQIQNRR